MLGLPGLLCEQQGASGSTSGAMHVVQGYNVAMVSQSIWAALTKCHKLGSLYPTEICFSQFWNVEVQDQGARKGR